jgi:hypothetical protein
MYSEMQQKLLSVVSDRVEKDKNVPYRTRIGISMFMQSPMDSTMQPASIMAAQPQPAMPPQQPQQGKKISTKAGEKLSKMGKTYQTKTQSAEADRSSRD